MLSEKQKECINMLIIGTKSIQEISNDLGCARSTIYAWKDSNEEFKAELEKRKREFEKGIVEEAKGLLTRVLGQTVQNLVDIANDKNEATDSRIRANKILLDKILCDAKPNIDNTAQSDKPKEAESINEIQKRIKEKMAKKCV